MTCMTDPTDRWSRLKQVHVVRVLLVYLGASWVVLQVTQTIVEAFKLPDPVLPTVIILLLIGLIVVVATAWVQSLASTTEGEESGALPSDWEIAPRDAIASIRKGRLPHLTWGRAVAGGVVALVLLFAGAGSYVGMRRLNLAGPTPASASEAATGIAIVPFEVRGAGLDIWREGMMDLLSHELDGVGGFRAIDSRTVLARWHDRIGEKSADQAMMLDVAKATGAQYALEGSVLAVGTSVRMITTVYDIGSGKEIADAQVEGPADSILQLADRLGVATLRSLLESTGRSSAATTTAEAITTNSMSALRAYLEGEQHYRKAEFARAVQSFEQAVAIDSTFAIALVELADSYGWLENSNSPRMIEVGKRAFALRDRLSPRYQSIMTGWDALNRNSADGVASLKAAVQKYPDDARVWFLLADTYVHVGGATYRTEDELWDALQRATTLDPGFAPYLDHLAEIAILRGDSVTARKTIDRYTALTGHGDDLQYIRLAIPYVLGTDQQAADAIKAAAKLPPNRIDNMLGTFASRHDRADRDAALDSIFGAVSHTNRAAMQVWYAATTGDSARARAAAANPEVSPSMRAQYAAYMYMMWNVQPPADVLEDAGCAPAAGICYTMVGAAYAGMGRWADHANLMRSVRAASAAEKDSTAARKMVETSEILRAIGMYRHGDLDGARSIFTRYASENTARGNHVRYELAMLEADANHPAEALRNFNSIRNSFWRSAGLLGSAMMHERLAQPAEARADYAHFLTLTAKGDQSLPAIAGARAAYARLQSKD
jgi:tetratricopeptide (TPR) repeat protein